MKIEKIVSIKFADEELTKFIADRVLELHDDEDWELIRAYHTLHEYEFRVFKKDTGDESEEH